ncbi:MAG TPA: glycosyltransferase family 2 protein [Candidatus Bilamarchaeaceae archaeon]|nr:glycosyltransferase family 2 protein [Candidatus Bilamarchaeaceae archaeon]
MEVAIVLPTLNEEKGIAKVLEELNALGKGKWDIFLADGGSTDNTLKIAKEKKANIISIPERGKGKAIKQVFQKVDASYLILMDGDATYPANAVPNLLDALKQCDVAIGSRFKGKIGEGAMSEVNKLGNRGLTLLGNLLYGKQVSDMCSGMWGFRKKAYKHMDISAKRFELEANFFIESAKGGFKICEVPIVYKKREGEAKLRVRDGLAIGYFLLSKRF